MKAIEKQIAARLLSAGELTEKDLEKALKRHTGRQSFADLLVEKGYTTKRAVARALAEVNGLEFVDACQLEPSPGALAILNREEAHQRLVLPVQYDTKRLAVVLADPNDVYTPDYLRARLGCEIIVQITEKDQLLEALDMFYPDPLVEGEDMDEDGPPSHREYQRRVREMRSSGMVPKNISQLETVIEESREQVPTQRPADSELPPAAEKPTSPAPGTTTETDLERFLRLAIEASARDVEFTPLERCVGVRVRTDSQWMPLGIYPLNQHDEIVAGLLALAGIEESWNDVKPDRELTLKTPFGGMACRILFQETMDGPPRVVIRFPDSVVLIHNPLQRLGLPVELSERIHKRIRAHAGGLLFITGGNARTLDHVYSSVIAGFSQVGGKDILSLEQFQRRRIPGVTPIHCPSDEALLMDLENAEFMTPDVIGIQMITGSETLRRAFDVSLGGTSIVACMTAPDMDTARACLNAAGIEPINLIRGMVGHVHVEVARKLCQHCAKTIENLDSLPEWARVMETDFREAAGCEKCNGTGYGEETYLVDFFHPEIENPDKGMVRVLERQTGLIALSVAGEIDPREYN